jgi:hypothetical protein
MAERTGPRAAGAGGSGGQIPAKPAEIEREIEERRRRLAATLDELSSRAKPKEIARRGIAGVQAKADAAVRTPEGQLRKERLGAVAGALVVLTALLVWLRRRH